MTLEFLIGAAAGLVLHEAGHVLATVLLGLKVKAIGVCRRGIYVRREAGQATANAVIAAAGPAVNLLLCLTWPWFPDVALVNAEFGIIFLLPIPHSDGSHLVAAISSIRAGRLPSAAVSQNPA